MCSLLQMSKLSIEVCCPQLLSLSLSLSLSLIFLLAVNRIMISCDSFYSCYCELTKFSVDIVYTCSRMWGIPLE